MVFITFPECLSWTYWSTGDCQVWKAFKVCVLLLGSKFKNISKAGVRVITEINKPS